MIMRSQPLHRHFVVPTLAVLAILGAACSTQQSATQPTRPTRPRQTTTTIPVTTTTSTSIGGFIATTTCPSLPVESDGYTGIQEGGVNVYYTVSGTAQQVLLTCTAQLEQAGWKVTAVPASTSGSSAGGLTATSQGAFGVINVGGSSQTASVAVCSWTSKPTDTTCSLGG